MKLTPLQKIDAEMGRHFEAISEIVLSHPECRFVIAYAMLGESVGVADSFGIDVAQWLNDLRAKHPKPDVLVPPKKEQS